ncbi:MAG TPA: metallophosphoesterase [Gammaproteobacteria bacterium]
MKLHILSDIHLEFAPFQIPETGADVVILAGDIGVGRDGVAWANERRMDKPVIYVPGNHEYYHHDISLLEQLKASAAGNVRVLDNELCIIDGVRFLCATLWTDFALYGTGMKYFAIKHAKRNMNDFSLIKNGSRSFSPEDSIQLHNDSRDWLKRTLSEPFDGQTVVVTHHAPCLRSIAPRFRGDSLTPAFITDLGYLMEASRIALWVHGHTHDAFDYVVNYTRVVCNPRGYVPDEHNNGFNAQCTIAL